MSKASRLLTTLTAIAVVASQTNAEEVSFRAKVEDGEALCYYCPGFGYIIDSSTTTLSSSVYDLSLFIGTYVEGVGTWDGSGTTPNIDITFMQPTPESFTIGGGGKIGKVLDFTAHGSQGDFAVVACAFGATTFLPLPDAGVCFLDIGSMRVLGMGTMGSNGEFNAEVLVPDVPAYVGITVFGQAAVFPPTGTPFITNPDAKTIKA